MAMVESPARYTLGVAAGFAWFSAGAADATVASSAATSLQICSFISTKYLKMNTKTIKKQRKIMTVKKGSKISHLRKNEK